MSGLDLVFAPALLAVVGAIAVADWRTMRIPDPLNLALALLGLAYQWLALQAFPAAAVLFALLVLGGFWLVRAGYRLLRGTAGLGLGDAKMAGAAALWFSPWNLALFLFVASFSALVYVAVSPALRGRAESRSRIPFGPFIGIALLAVWAIERTNLPTFVPSRGY